MGRTVSLMRLRSGSLVLAAAITVIAVTSSATVTIAGPVDSGWRQFQYGPSHTGYNPSETTLGPDTVGQIQRLWKTTIPGTYISPASVANGRVVVGSSSGTLYSLSATTGAPDWSAAGGSGSSTPAIVRGRVYQLSNGTVYSFDAWSGSLRWSVPTGGSSSVTVSHGVVYAMGYYRVYAIDRATGAVLWNPAAPLFGFAPSVFGGRLYVHGTKGNVVAYDSATGTELWKRRGLNHTGHSSIAISKKRLYVGADQAIYALYARRGATVWQAGEPDGCCGCYDITPAVAEGVVYTAGCGEIIKAYDAMTGALLWSSPVAATGGPVTVANGVVWGTRSDGKLLGFDAATGDLIVSRTLDDKAASSVVVTEGVVYLSAGGSVYAYGLPA
jgi:outer membrane protein assembly factor BamB